MTPSADGREVFVVSSSGRMLRWAVVPEDEAVTAGTGAAPADATDDVGRLSLKESPPKSPSALDAAVALARVGSFNALAHLVADRTPQEAWQWGGRAARP